MFEYDSVIGKAVIGDKNHRLKSYLWTGTGINLKIPEMRKKMDVGKYEATIVIGQNSSQATIEVKEILGQSFICVSLPFKL